MDEFVSTRENPFSPDFKSGTTLYDEKTNIEFTILNCLCVFNRNTNYIELYSLFVDKSPSSQNYPLSVADYLDWQEKRASKSYIFKWEKEEKQLDAISLDLRSCLNGYALPTIINFPRHWIKNVHQFDSYGKEFRPILRTIHKLWIKQHYYKTYLNGDNNEM